MERRQRAGLRGADALTSSVGSDQATVTGTNTPKNQEKRGKIYTKEVKISSQREDIILKNWET